MQLYDKDLLSVQEVRDLVEKAKKAQQEFAQKSQEEVDAIVKSVAEAGVRNAKRLAKMAHEETGFGIEADKVIKNVFGSRGVYEAIKDMKTIGVLEVDEEKKTKKIAIPVGIVAGLIPSTNPTSTAFYKSEIALKGGNAIIFSPHPNAKNCIVEAVKVIRTAIAEAGGNEDLVSVITIPTIQATDMLMKHPDVAMILATGGSAMVRAAYSSGTPAIGVGPGNGPAYIEKTADVALAVKRIMDSKTFDNGTICASEQSVMCDCDMEPAVRVEMEKQGAYFLNDEQIAKLGKFILRANGTMNPQIVGKSAQVIADLAEIEIPEGTRVLVAKETGIDEVHAKLLPQDKLSTLKKLRETYTSVMFVGDGINDAPVLAGADVGAAMGSGADAAIEAADVVFMTSSMSAIPDALRIAKSAVAISWQNIVFALAIKIAVMILGLCGFASMWMAVFADTGVAMLCVLNSIRVLYKK